MRVSLVMPSAFPTGGAEEALLQLLSSNAAKRVNWNVLFLEPGPLQTQVGQLCDSAEVAPCGRTREFYKWWKAAGRIASSAKAFKSDLLFGWMTKGHVYAGMASLRSGIPCDWFQHGLPERGLLELASALLPKRRIYACSSYVASLQRKQNPRSRIIAVCPGVNISRFDLDSLPSAQACKANLGLPEGRAIVGIVGRLQRWKGMHVLINAMADVVKTRSDALCLIVGGPFSAEPNYLQELQEQVERKRLNNHVRFVGAQSNIPEWMQAMDVYVHASRREPFGIVVIEAMSLGKPVIATRPGGPEEIIASGQNGLLCEEGNSSMLSQQILELLESTELRKKLGQSAIATCKSYFSSEAYASRLIDQLMSDSP